MNEQTNQNNPWSEFSPPAPEIPAPAAPAPAAPASAAPAPAGFGPPPAAREPYALYRGGVPVRCPHCGHVVVTPVCGFCGAELSRFYTAAGRAIPPDSPPPAAPPAYLYPPPVYLGDSRRKSGRAAWIAALCCLLSVVLIACGVLLVFRLKAAPPPNDPIPGFNPGGFPGSDAPENYYAPYGVSPAEYRQIREGMSYALISQIIGGDGQLIDPSDPAAALQSDYVIYGWPGELDPNASLFIKFINGRAVEITPKGLDE